MGTITVQKSIGYAFALAASRLHFKEWQRRLSGGDLQRPIHGNQHARNGLRQFSRFLVAVAALVGVLATFCAGAQSCGIVQWGAGNEYPPGPYSSPVEACAIRNGEVDDASGGWGSGAIVTFSNAHVRASTWGGTPIGGYPGSGVSCGYTITITGPDISSPVVFDPGDSLPFVFAIVPPASCPKASPKRPRRKTSAVHARSPSAAIIGDVSEHVL
jgi:hypothetical protein